METTIKKNFESVISSKVLVKTKENLISNFFKDAESNRLAIAPLLLLVMSIVGGVAASFGIMDSWVKLSMVAFPSTIALAMILSVAPMRVIFITATIAIILDIFIIFF